MSTTKTTPRQTKQKQPPQTVTISVTELTELKQQLNTMQETLKVVYDSVRVEVSALISCCKASNTLHDSMATRNDRMAKELKTLKFLQGFPLN